MIIFYNKKTGKITGTINGRVHPPQELKMWVGSKDENDRIVVEWSPTGKEYETETNEERFIKLGVNEQGQDILKRELVKKKVTKRENEPQHDQKDIFKSFDKKSMEAYKYKVDTQTRELILL